MQVQTHAFGDALKFRSLPGADRKGVALIRGDVASVPVTNLKLRAARAPCRIWQEAALTTHLAELVARPAHVFTPCRVTHRLTEQIGVNQRCINSKGAVWPQQRRRQLKEPFKICRISEEWEEVTAGDHEPRAVPQCVWGCPGKEICLNQHCAW